MTAVIFLVLLIGARVLPLALLLPSAFTAGSTWRWSLGLIVLLSAVLVPTQLAATVTLDALGVASLLWGVAREGIVGLALALGFTVLLSGLQLTAGVLGQMAGINWVMAGEAAGGRISVTQRYFGMLAVATFVVSGGHRELVSTLLDSFTFFPPGSELAEVDAARLLAEVLAQSFAFGVHAAAPVAFCLFIAAVIVAVLGRGSPMLGTFGMGLTVNLIVLLLVTCASLEAISTLYQQHWSAGVERIVRTMQEVAP